MPRQLKASASNITPAPAGIHNARIFRIADLGTQTIQFKGKPPKQIPQIRIWAELVDTAHAFDPEKPKDKKPFSVMMDLTFTLTGDSKLKNIIQSINNIKVKPGDSVDVYSKLLNKPCQVQVVHSEPNAEGKVFPNIKEIFAPNPKVKVKELFNETVTFDLADFDKDVFLALPQKTQEKIKLSPEFQNDILLSGSLASDSAAEQSASARRTKGKPKKGK